MAEARASALATRQTGDGRPPLVVVAREGDGRGALAVAVNTEGIKGKRGALAGVALAALVQTRLAARGVEAVTLGGWNGWRLRTLIASPADAGRVIDAVRAALIAPVSADEPGMAAAVRKAAALAARPLVDNALADVAQCTGEAFGTGAASPPSPADVESWRAASHGLGRLAIAAAGDPALAEATAHALERTAPWPKAAPVSPSASAAARPDVVLYDASDELPPGAARIVLTARTGTAERAVAAAHLLGDARGPLASRLEALEAAGHLRSVVATANAEGGCLAVTIDLAEHDLVADGPSRIATAAALAKQELAVEVADVTPPPDLGHALSRQAADPRDAAERAAWWSLAGRRTGPAADDVQVNLAVGMAAPREATETATLARAQSLRGELDRATLAWHASVVDARTRVEAGQGELWVLLASPCGTLPEGASDAGAGATVALAAAAEGANLAGDAHVEPFVAADGVGIMVHGPSRRGESPEAHARRLADVAARAFAADSLPRQPLSRARTALLLQASRADALPRGMLASVLAPEHPSWVDPFGTVFGLSALSDETVALRAAAIRSGPLRVAVLANVDSAQADAAAHAVDRWIARRPSEARACPSIGIPSLPPPATYALDRPLGAMSEAILAIPLSADDPATQRAAPWLAAALDGSGGLLSRALGADAPDATPKPLAQTWSALFVGAPRAPALILRLTAPDASLDAAVAQSRALLDRIRLGALGEDDRKRAGERVAHAVFASSLDPRERTIALWRSEALAPSPALQELRAFAASSIHDEALVIVAARPARVDPTARMPTSHDSKPKSKE